MNVLLLFLSSGLLGVCYNFVSFLPIFHTKTSALKSIPDEEFRPPHATVGLGKCFLRFIIFFFFFFDLLVALLWTIIVWWTLRRAWVWILFLHWPICFTFVIGFQHFLVRIRWVSISKSKKRKNDLSPNNVVKVDTDYI